MTDPVEVILRLHAILNGTLPGPYHRYIEIPAELEQDIKRIATSAELAREWD